ncbi:MAG: DUF3617 domain-containing protein [Pseudobdellovibrio sp.]|nr:DUF3617 domain-containing protein [Pseudobdellovibrio sp.]
MKYLITLAIATFALQSQAAFKLKPGLWEVETTTSVNGKTHDSQGQMQEMMKKMTPEQRAQMEKMMGSKGMGFGDKGMKVCHTEKSMSDEALVHDPKSKCKITDKKDLTDGVRFNVQCDKGSGSAEYHRTSDSAYTGWNEFQTAKGKSRMEFKGKFISNNCGNVKPLTEAK